MWIFCWRSFLLPVIFAAICSRAISSSSDPKIFSPTFGTSWEVGSRVQITWNSSFRLPDGLYYNSHTRLTIRLYEEDGTFVTVIITDYPMSIGYLYWTVPQNTTGNRVLGSNTTAYFLKVYPSFFDWPRSCPGCASKAPHTDLFTIKPGVCSDATCDAGGSPGPLGTPWSNDPSESYLRSVRSVAIGVGIIALIFFTIAFLIYTKKGWKSWEQYRSRKNGLQYKYRPGDSRRNLPGPFPPSGPSPGEAHTIEGFDSAYRPPGSSFLDVGFGSQLDEDSVLDSEMSYPIPQHQKLPTLKTSAHLDVPPRRPPRPYTPPVESKSGIISVQCDSGKYEGDLEEKQLADERIIDESEAILVGHTFRNALRVACEDNNSGDQSDVKALDDPKNSTLSELESSCSPVLSRLQCV